MSDKSAIEWTDATWNPVTGCSKVSPGCANCYAETISLRFGHSLKPWAPENAVENVVLHPDRLDQPLRWQSPRMVFVNSMSDLFHELIPDSFIAEVFDVMARARQHTFQVLTKRPERARAFVDGAYSTHTRWGAGGPVPLEWTAELPLPNVWLGVSIENARFTWRADVLREIPAAVRFISAEPLLDSLYPEVEANSQIRANRTRGGALGEPGYSKQPLDLTGIDWLIVGGESGGRQARPMHPDWARELRDACVTHPDGVPFGPRTGPAFFFKQWGSWGLGSRKNRPSLFICSDGFTTEDPWNDPRLAEDRQRDGKTERWQSLAWMGFAGASPKAGGRLLDGREWNEMPKTRQKVAA